MLIPGKKQSESTSSPDSWICSNCAATNASGTGECANCFRPVSPECLTVASSAPQEQVYPPGFEPPTDTNPPWYAWILWPLAIFALLGLASFLFSSCIQIF